jgi:hypothetical protein
MKYGTFTPTSQAGARSSIGIGGIQTLTDGATITFNLAARLNAVVTIAASRNLSITNGTTGDSGRLLVLQDGANTKTLTLTVPANVQGDTEGTLTTTATATLFEYYFDGTTYFFNSKSTVLGSMSTQNASAVAITGGTVAADLTLGTSTGAAIGRLWRNVNSIQYKDSTNTTRTLLDGASNLSGLTSPSTARSSIGIGGIQTLTDGATITFNLNLGLNAVVTISGNRTLSVSNAVAGDSGWLRIVQDGTGGRSITLPTPSIVGGITTTAINILATANANSYLRYFFDGTRYHWSPSSQTAGSVDAAVNAKLNLLLLQVI